jgi:hypothetical protein
VSAFIEDICLKTQKTPYFGGFVTKYAKWLTVTDKTNVFHSTFPTLPECYENWTKVSYKRRSPNSDIVTKTKHSKESKYWLNQPATSNRFSVLQELENEGQQKTSHTCMPKPPSICVSGVKTSYHLYSC